MIEKKFIYVNKDYQTLIDFLLCNQQTSSETPLDFIVYIHGALGWPDLQVHLERNICLIFEISREDSEFSLILV